MDVVYKAVDLHQARYTINRLQRYEVSTYFLIRSVDTNHLEYAELDTGSDMSTCRTIYDTLEIMVRSSRLPSSTIGYAQTSGSGGQGGLSNLAYYAVEWSVIGSLAAPSTLFTAPK